MPHTLQKGALDTETRQCVEECLTCHNTCLTTVSYCLQKGGPHADVNHIVTLLDCAEICSTSADFMLRGSHLHTTTCAACAEVCRACAESCDTMRDDDVMRNCAEECRRCAESCERMAGIQNPR
jgi:hypothetical protein